MVVRPVDTLGARGLLSAGRRLGTAVLFGVVPAVALCPIWAPWTMIDFTTFRRAGSALLAGASPYPPVDADVLATGLNFVYPAPVAFAFAPLALIPLPVAAALWALVLIGATVGTLLLAGVRDWRCIGLAFVSPWVLNGLWVGAISPLLALALAVAWRYRERRAIAALAVAALMVSKVFLWPLLVWLAATRRTPAAVAAAAGGAVASLAAWAALDFAGLADYPRILDLLAQVEQDQTYSAVALGLSLGLGAGTAQALAVAAGAAGLVTTVLLGRRGADLSALTAALAVALLLSPIIWPHYFALALVPLAVARPRLGPLWLTVLLPWLTTGESGGVAWKIVVGLGAGLAVLALTGVRVPQRPAAAQA